MAFLDFFDPNTWSRDDFEYRIYADDYANDYAIVDEIDYQYLAQWRWKLCFSRIHAGTKRPKAYLGRSVPTIIGKDYKDENGKRKQQRIVSTVFLHQVVMTRKGDIKPISNKKIVIDHANGKEFDCRRSNLRYTTIGFNNMNKFGSHERMLIGGI